MSRHKHKKRHPSLPQANTPAALRQSGLTAFHQNDFDAAIARWSRLNIESEPAVRPALAEAHFRRALVAREVSLSTADLTRALELSPTEARYRYHLGLAYHRADRLAEALDAYGRAVDAGYRGSGGDFVRGLAEIELNPHLDLETLGWLSPEDRAALSPIAALLRGDSQTALASDSGGWIDRLKARITAPSPHALWRGLALLSAGQTGQALDALTLPSGQSFPAGAEAVRAFYRGQALSATGDPEAALAEWTSAARRSNPRLQSAITGAHLRRVRALLDAGQWADALKAAQAALKVTPGQPAFVAAALVAHNRLADRAGADADWGTAIAHYGEIRALLTSSSDSATRSEQGLGPVAPVLHNLAVAHEMLEQWEPAADAWRALMGTLPRRQARTKAKAAEPDGRPASLPVADHRNWLRKRILACYQKAGKPDQAIALYRQAVKANSEELDLRLELANALLANDQVIAARNELARVLERDPKHLEAQIRLAEVQQLRGEVQEAERLLRAALETDPKCDSARRGLVEILRQRSHGLFNAGRVPQSREIYKSALELAPDDVDLRVSLGYAELRLGRPTAGREHFEAAMAKGDATAYLGVFHRWVLQKDRKEAGQILARAEAAGVASPSFCVDAAEACFNDMDPSDPLLSLFGAPRPKRKRSPDPWEALGRDLLQKAEAAGGNQTEVLQRIVFALGPKRPALALEYAQRLAGCLPDDPAILIALALLQAINDQTRHAKESLRRAAGLARKQGDPEMISHIEDLRRQIDNPFFGMSSMIAPLLSSFEE